MARSSSELIPEDTLAKMSIIFKAGAHTVRLQIVNMLLNRECQVLEIYKAMAIKQPRASIQLGILKFAGVVKSRRDGNKV